MIYLFEGHDGVGKTTLARRFSYLTGIPYYVEYRPGLRPGMNWRDIFETRQKTFLDLYHALNFDIVVDRSYISEWVYSEFFRKHDDERPDTRDLCLEFDELYGACFLIGVTASVEKVIERIAGKGEKAVYTFEQHEEILEMFDERFIGSGSEYKILVNNENKTVAEAVEEIIASIRDMGGMV